MQLNSILNPKNIKLLIIAIVVIIVIVVSIQLTPHDSKHTNNVKKEQGSSNITMTVTGDNKVQTYNSFVVDEWNGYRFKYRSDWTIKKEYNDKGTFIGITIYPQNKKNDNDYIVIGKDKKNCTDVKMVKCIIAGYGLIMQPVYTYSSDSDVSTIYNGIIKSIEMYQGKSEYDIEKIRTTIETFISAKKSNNFNKAKVVMSANLLNGYDSREFSTSAEGKIGRYEFVEDSKYLDFGYYQVPVKVYGYFEDEKNEIGYWNYLFKVKIVNNEYLIDEINIGNFQSNK
jgi:hypothetical protein